MEDKKPDKFADRSWLDSDDFAKRAFAIYGHVIVAHLIIMAVILIISFIIGAFSA